MEILVSSRSSHIIITEGYRALKYASRTNFAKGYRHEKCALQKKRVSAANYYEMIHMYIWSQQVSNTCIKMLNSENLCLYVFCFGVLTWLSSNEFVTTGPACSISRFIVLLHWKGFYVAITDHDSKSCNTILLS